MLLIVAQYAQEYQTFIEGYIISFPGTNGSDYFGHVFWDMETWMYPPILMFRPDFAKDMLSYRINKLNAAMKNAITSGLLFFHSLKIQAQGLNHSSFLIDCFLPSGYKGARYPWESAYSGYEASPSIETGTYEQHITGKVTNISYNSLIVSLIES